MYWPEPRLLYVVDKTYATPLRLLHFLAPVTAFAGAFRLVRRFAPRLAEGFSMLGRNSLNVFCVGSILSLIGQIARFAMGNALTVDAAILVGGVALLGLTAWLSELRDRLRAASSPVPSPVLPPRPA